MKTKSAILAGLIFLFTLAASSSPLSAGQVLEIREVQGVPVLWEYGMPYFTRFSETDHGVLDLSGTWKFKPDPDDRGVDERWFDPGLDLISWFDHPVPGSWNVQRPEWLDYVGAGWYRTSFRVPESFSGRFNRLVLDGVAYRGQVYLNGKLVGRHSGGFTRWSLDVSDALDYSGPNHLVIRVDNTRDFDSLPPLISKGGQLGWWPYGGINRAVTLESGPSVTLCKLAAETDHLGNIAVHGVIFNKPSGTKPVQVRVILKDLAGNPIKNLFQQQVHIDGDLAAFHLQDRVQGVEAWSTVRPGNRYNLEIQIDSLSGSEVQSVQIGFRKFEFRDGRALLNGKPIFLRGVNRHEDFPEDGAVLTENRISQDMDLLHQMHVNFMRPAHFPNDPRWLDACDREGILITHEIPVYQVGSGFSPKSIRAAEGEALYTDAAMQLIEMIERDRNHPSVVIWSVGNENWPFVPSVRKLLKRLYGTAKRFDPERPVTFALITSPFRITPALDMLADIPDVLFVNEYYGWYFGKAHRIGPYLDAVHKKYPDKPIVVSEFGAGAVIGRAPGDKIPVGYGVYREFTEEYQEYFHRTQLEQILSKPYVVGTMPWVFADFRDDKRPKNPIPMMNLKGLVNYERQKKKAFDVFAEAYAEIEKEYRQ